MKLIFYFLVLMNIAILLFNWDDFTNRNFVYSTKQEGETLRLANEQQVPARSLAEQSEPPVLPNMAARFIDSVLDFMSSIGNILRDFFRDDRRPLPEEASPDPPPFSSRSPTRPQTADYCIDIGAYDQLAAARALSASLTEYGISSSIKTKSRPSGPFSVIALVRADLGVAMELSELLSENGIRNSVKENRPLGYLLVSTGYRSEAAATRALNQIKKLGLSAKLDRGKATKNSYFIHIAKPTVPKLEALPNLAELKSKVGLPFTKHPDC